MSARIGFRLPDKDRGLIEKVCASRGEDISDFVRRAVKKELASLGFLSDEEQRALGVTR